MNKLVKYTLESGATPKQIIRGGIQLSQGAALIGAVLDVVPPQMTEITYWDMLNEAMSVPQYKNDDTTFQLVEMTAAEVVAKVRDIYLTLMLVEPTSQELSLYQSRLLSAFDYRIARFNEQTELGITPTDADVDYTDKEGNVRTGKTALLMYKQEVREVDANYTGSLFDLVFPIAPS